MYQTLSKFFKSTAFYTSDFISHIGVWHIPCNVEALFYQKQLSMQMFIETLNGWDTISCIYCTFSHRHTDYSMSDPISVVSLLCEAMTEQGKDVKTQVNYQDNFGQTSLHRAALRGATICSLNLLQVEKSVITLDDSFVLIHQLGEVPEIWAQ